jgi:hypothetical protein
MSENNIHDLLNRIENSLESLNTQNISNTFENDDISNLLRNSLNNIRQSGRTTIRIPIGVMRTTINSDESTGISEEEFEYLYDYIITHDIDETCSICMEKYKKNDSVIQLDCDHIFHKSCLKTWLQNHNTCPVCRYDIKNKFEEYKMLINKLAMYQSIINIIPNILLHNPPDEEENEENSGLFGWVKWGLKKLGSYFIDSQ